MDRFEGIKKPKIKVRRNGYKIKKKRGPLWRYIVAAALVAAIPFVKVKFDFDVARLFEDDYGVRLAQKD